MYPSVTAKLLHYARVRPMTNIKNYRMQNPYSLGRFGCLPSDWLKGVDTFERAPVTDSVHDVLREYSCQLRSAKISSCSEYDSSVHGGDKLIKRLKEILKRDDVKLEYDNHGRFKDCTKITVGDKSYALVTMRSNVYSGPMGSDDILYSFLAYNRGSQGRFARPFMGNYHNTGEYLLSKYIEDSHPRKVDLDNILGSRQYIVHSDVNDINSKLGIKYDGGGILINERYIADPFIRYNWFRFANKLHSERSLILRTFEFDEGRISFSDKDKVQNYLFKLKHEGVDLCNVDARELMKDFTPEERKFAIKLICVLRKARKLKKELLQTGEYEEYKKLLTEDLRYNYPFTKYSDFVRICRGYPKLVADELGVNNLPEKLDEDTFYLFSAGQISGAVFKKLFTRDQVKSFLLSKTCGFGSAYERLAELYNLEKEYYAHRMKVFNDLGYFNK